MQEKEKEQITELVMNNNTMYDNPFENQILLQVTILFVRKRI